MNLTQKDLTILYHLKKDSRMSLTTLGKKLDLTPAAIAYRMNRLVENKVIKGFTIEINNSLLTPNYRSYQIEGQISTDKIEGRINNLQQTDLFDQIFIRANFNNFLAISNYVSNEKLTQLAELLHNENIINYSITPIISEFKGSLVSDLFAEDVSPIYCPECQKSVEGKQVVITLVGSQTMSFCCESCRKEFLEQYNKLSKVKDNE